MKTYGLFSPSETPTAANPKQADSKKAEAPDNNLEKFSKLVETCYRRSKPSETQLQMLEHFRQRYDIPQADTDKLIAKFSYSQDQQKALYNYGLMYRAFLENNGEIDFEQQSQLLELQEEF